MKNNYNTVPGSGSVGAVMANVPNKTVTNTLREMDFILP